MKLQDDRNSLLFEYVCQNLVQTRHDKACCFDALCSSTTTSRLSNCVVSHRLRPKN
jgi:hypothetical protein